MKKIAIMLILVLGLITLVGCSTDNESKMVSHVLTMKVEDDTTGELIEEATVTVYQDGKKLFDKKGGNGVQVPLEDGTYTIEAEADGYIKDSEEFVINGEADVSTITLTEKASPVTVTVEDGQGNTLENAEVTVGSDKVMTDANGQAVINLKDGEHTVQANAIGYTGDSQTLTIDGSAQSISLEVTAATKSYLYSSAGTVDIANTIDTWGSGTGLTTDYSGDADYSPIIEAVSGTNWGADAAVVAFTGLNAGELANYNKLVFKVKSDQYSSLRVKIPDTENEYVIADNGVDLGNGWYQVEIDLADFSDAVDSAVEVAIHNNFYGSPGKMYITDVYVY
ncbi:Ig-like domain-containing protein [Halanaerobacter jeridensis]|uniref:Carboxypeptidase regulatory-like domain-containing protein n=1 Tax=Halanaerobacter jeridensis TaxID=706427 RepID=A0A938XQF4_9FIRM|nr:Ig-like domain-containing protein [Halanaerobacter jeridensis]MBM7555689.1 hypothetical protein [Halanaerobacter jeridensis]